MFFNKYFWLILGVFMALSGPVMAIRWLKGSRACGVGKVTVLAPSNGDMTKCLRSTDHSYGCQIYSLLSACSLFSYEEGVARLSNINYNGLYIVKNNPTLIFNVHSNSIKFP